MRDKLKWYAAWTLGDFRDTEKSGYKQDILSFRKCGHIISGDVRYNEYALYLIIFNEGQENENRHCSYFNYMDKIYEIRVTRD